MHIRSSNYTILIYGIIYFLGAALGNFLSFDRVGFATLWPPTGILTAALILTKTSDWHKVLAATASANLLFNHILDFDLLQNFVFTFSNCLQSLSLGYATKRYLGGVQIFRRLRPALAFMAINILLTCPIISTIGAAAVYFAEPKVEFWTTWRLWWISNGLGIAVFTPLMGMTVCEWRAWQGRSRNTKLAIIASSVGAIAVTAFISWQVFITHEDIIPVIFVFPFTIYLCLTLNSLYLRPAAAFFGGTVATLFAVYGTTRGQGVIVSAMPNIADQYLVLEITVTLQIMITMIVSLTQSDRDYAQSRLKQAKDIAENASKVKSKFMANMSHEIRTPINSVLGYSELIMNDRKSSAATLQYASTINRNGKSLLNLVNDILDLAKVESGSLELNCQVFTLSTLLEDIFAELRVIANTKNVTLECKSLGMIPQNIVSDSAKIKQILINLLGNSIKFSDRGNVYLQISCCQDSKIIYFDVYDQGIGIPERCFKHLFHDFYQVDSESSKRFQGSGLGLSLARKLARRLDGDVVLVRSIEGEGSHFKAFIKVDFTKPESENDDTNLFVVAEHGKDNIDSTKRLQGRKILLCEDFLDNQVLFTCILENEGAQVAVASDGNEALKAVANESYDLILMDIQMPYLDGFSATKALRTQGIVTPILALTAHAMVQEHEKCLAAGCDDFISKPVDRAELINRISHYLN